MVTAMTIMKIVVADGGDVMFLYITERTLLTHNVDLIQVTILT
jgi:hypothetical protein